LYTNQMFMNQLKSNFELNYLTVSFDSSVQCGAVQLKP
jgi:hypothetical protein